MPIDFESWKENMAQQQAQFWADLRALEARQAETARLSEENRQNIAKLVEVCMSLTNHVESLTSHAQETDRRLRELGEVTDRRILEVGERLDVLISVVDKLVKRNGQHN
jgi:hypothetical protein